MQAALHRVGELLFTCGTPEEILPPTALYCEGWLLRLVVDWYSRHAVVGARLSFSPGARWYSEALIGSQFRARHRGDALAESWTHADGVIGHVHRRARRGDIELDAQATQLVVAEAKLFSGLSAGTTRASTFNQAARNVACIAELLVGRDLAEFERLAFIVLAPDEQIRRNVFGSLCSRASVERTVQARVAQYAGEKDEWLRCSFLPVLERIELHFLSWEAVLADVLGRDPKFGEHLQQFYARCLEFNRPKARMTAERTGE